MSTLSSLSSQVTADNPPHSLDGPCDRFVACHSLPRLQSLGFHSATAFGHHSSQDREASSSVHCSTSGAGNHRLQVAESTG